MNKIILIGILIAGIIYGTTNATTIHLNNEYEYPIKVKINCLFKTFKTTVPASVQLKAINHETLLKPGYAKIEKKIFRFDSIEYEIIKNNETISGGKTKRPSGTGFGDWFITITKNGVIME